MTGKRVGLGALLCASGFLVACGGGGGSDPLTLNFVEGSIAKAYYDWDIPEAGYGSVTVPVNARVSGRTSAAQVYVAFIDPAGTFTETPNFYEIDVDLYQIDLALQPGLANGNYSGTVEARLCSDPACANVLSSDTLPYSINVRPNPALAVTTSGSLVGRALATQSNDPAVVGFHLPALAMQVAPVPAQFRSNLYLRVTDPDARVGVVGYSNYSDYAYFEGVPANGQFQLDFKVLSHLPQGEYAGALTLQFCRDPQCEMAFSGASTLPYTLSVGTGSLVDLVPAAGAPEWQTRDGGNAAHTAHVPMTVDPASFAPRWISRFARYGYDYGVSDNDIVTLDGKVLVRVNSAERGLYALDETDGTQAWRKELYGIGPPLVANGRVYVRSQEPRALHAFDASGATVFEQPIDTINWSVPLVPLGDDLLGWDQTIQPNTSYAYQFNRYDGATGALLDVPACLRTIEELNRVDNFPRMLRVPPTAGETAYFLADSGLEIVDFGEAQSCTSVPWTFGYAGIRYSWDGPTVLAPGGNVVHTTCLYNNYYLRSLDPVTGVVDFDVPFGCAEVAIADGVVYTGGVARSEATGEQLWTAPAGLAIGAYSSIVTDNMLFVKGTRTYAIDLATRQVVWSLSPTSGTMALSPNGVLYVLQVENGSSVSGEWALIAINVR